jgi:hypothetical protein
VHASHGHVAPLVVAAQAEKIMISLNIGSRAETISSAIVQLASSAWSVSEYVFEYVLVN